MPTTRKDLRGFLAECESGQRLDELVSTLIDIDDGSVGYVEPAPVVNDRPAE